MNSNAKLFVTGVIQVYFVAINTCFLANHIYLGVLFAAFAISMVWSYNVKKIVFGTMLDRFFYSSGAAAGSLLGLLSSDYLAALLNLN